MKLSRATWFIQSALAHASRRAHRWYHPERHYMRGPGPKTLDKIGEMLRAEAEGTTREPLPEHWHDLIRRMDDKTAEEP